MKGNQSDEAMISVVGDERMAARPRRPASATDLEEKIRGWELFLSTAEDVFLSDRRARRSEV